METNLIFLGISIVVTVLMVIHGRKANKGFRAEQQAKEEALEAWHQKNPGHRWAARSVPTHKVSSLEGTAWTTTTAPFFE